MEKALKTIDKWTGVNQDDDSDQEYYAITTYRSPIKFNLSLGSDDINKKLKLFSSKAVNKL